MRRTRQCHSPSRPRSARWRSPSRHFCRFLAAIGLAIAVAPPTIANDSGQQLGESGVYLESGLPRRTNLQGPFSTSVNENLLIGADRFYNAGFTGTRAVMANIEAGYIWNGHETLAHVGLIPTSGNALPEADRHATWVGMVMGGRPGGANPGPYQQGIAPDAQLFSGAIATSWSGARWTGSFFFDYSNISTFGPYRAAFINGLATPSGARTADVINSSWAGVIGSGDHASTDSLSATLDALINENPRTLLTLAAGNTVPTGEGPNRVPTPASGYNNLSVAAIGPNGGAYDLPSYFTNGGPNDYYDPVNGEVLAIRQVVDIAAPGENFSTAYYGGQTGGNRPSLGGQPDGSAGGPDWYTHTVSGTSFAAPTVAGGAALLYDAAYAVLGSTPNARDSRVMKAVLMNSADKTLGWDNGQTANPNGFGGVLTMRGLDDRVGAGRMNLNRAFDQLLNGITDILGTLQGPMGPVNPLGWDFGQVAQGITNDYLINSVLEAGSSFTATLTWFRDRQTFSTTGFYDNSYDNLDLELWSAVAGLPVNLISASDSRYNNTEHFRFAIPTTGQYLLRVRWTEELFDNIGDLNIEQYGLAWATSVPEPGTLVLLAYGTACWLIARRRR